LGALWNTDLDSTAMLRAQFTTVVGSAAAEPGALPRALPFLYSTLVGVDVLGRAAAVTALGRLLDEDGLRDELPDLVTEGLINALFDNYLIVIATACDVIARVKMPSERLIDVLERLLNIADTYARKHENSDMVADAIAAVRILSKGTRREASMDTLLLRIIDVMQPYEAVKHLARMHSLVVQPSWVPSVVKALREITASEYQDVLEDEKERLLKQLSQKPSEQLKPHVKDLVSIALSEVPESPHRAYQVADILSSLEEYDAAMDIARHVVDAFPDTTEKRPARLQVQEVHAAFAVEAATAAEDEVALSQALQDWASTRVAIAQDAEENQDARRPFNPSFIPE